MSWFKQNYDKAIMGVAVLTLLGVGASIALNVSGEEPAKRGAGGTEKEEYGDSLEPAAKTTLADLSDPAKQGVQAWQTRNLETQQVARLFVGPPLVLKANATDDKVEDALHPDTPPFRGSVPNAWLLKYFDKEITHSKILQKDPDNDLFTNEEEFLGGSDPRDPNSKPSAVMKLKLKEVVVDKCEIKFTALGANEFQFKRTKSDPADPKKPDLSKSNLAPVQGQPLWADDGKRFEFLSVATKDQVVTATVKDNLDPVGSPFEVATGKVVDRPTFQVKILCTVDNAEETKKAGDAFSFAAFPNISFKIIKINPGAEPSVEIEYTEAGKPAKTAVIK